MNDIKINRPIFKLKDLFFIISGCYYLSVAVEGQDSAKAIGILNIYYDEEEKGIVTDFIGVYSADDVYDCEVINILDYDDAYSDIILKRNGTELSQGEYLV